MNNFFKTLRTVIHLKPVQILNRVWRKRLTLFGTPRRPAQADRPLGTFTFLNVTGNPVGWNDPSFEKLWLYNLHYFDWLNVPQASRSADNSLQEAELLNRWISENPVGWGNGWEPYPTSLRIVNWVKWFARQEKHAREGEYLALAGRMKASLILQVEHLLPRLEYHLLANHLLANAKALVFAGSYLGNENWLHKGTAIYRRELPRQTCADGINFERSPMYHAIILEDLLDCLEMLSQAEGRDSEREMFRAYAGKMLEGLVILTGPDGKIAKFNDSSEGIAKSPAELFERAGTLGLPRPTAIPCAPGLASSGFIRISAGTLTLLAKCGDIGPAYQPGHAHADTYSFELWQGTTKIIGDTGCSTYVPGAVRSYERSTAAHNTVVIDGENSSEVWASHRVGRRFDFRRHRRTFALSEKALKAEDAFEGRGEHDLDIRFHLPPDIPTDLLEFDCPGVRTIEPCAFADGWNRRVTGTCVSFRQRVRFPTRVKWRILPRPRPQDRVSPP